MNLSLTRTQVFIAVAGTALLLIGIGSLWSYGFGVEILPCLWRWTDVVYGLILGAVITAISQFLYHHWGLYRRSADDYLHLVLSPLLPWDLLWLGILPSISEEFLFRGVILPHLGMNSLGIGITSVIFGTLHMSSWRHLPYTLWAMIVGVGLGVATVITHNLLPVIIAHALTNSLSGYFWQRYQAQANLDQNSPP